MENEGNIVELLTESFKGQDPIIDQLKEMNQRLDGTNQRLDRLENRTKKVADQLIKLNLQTVENSSGFSNLLKGWNTLPIRITWFETGKDRL